MHFYFETNFFLKIYDLNIDKNIKIKYNIINKMLGVFYEKNYYFINHSTSFNYSMFKWTSSKSEKSKSEIEFIEDDADNFVYEEAETNIIKTNETKTTSKENKISEIKTNEIKTTNESKENKANENLEIKNANETVSENKINDTEKIVYIAKTGKKYHLENCRTLRGEKEAIDLNEAIKNGYEVCKVCKPDGIWDISLYLELYFLILTMIINTHYFKSISKSISLLFNGNKLNNTIYNFIKNWNNIIYHFF